VEHVSAQFYVLSNVPAQFSAVMGTAQGLGSCLPAALQHSLNASLARRAAAPALKHPLFAVLVHVPSLAADESANAARYFSLASAYFPCPASAAPWSNSVW
jgi:hypothetical protein